MADDSKKKEKPPLTRRSSKHAKQGLIDKDRSELKPDTPSRRNVEKWSKQQLHYWLESNKLQHLKLHFLDDEEKRSFDTKYITEETYMFDKHPEHTNQLILVKASLPRLFTLLTTEPHSNLRTIWEHEVFVEQFLTTLHFFTTPKDVLTALEERYNYIPEPQETSDSDEDEDENPRENVEAPTVIEVMKQFVMHDPINDLLADADLVKQFKAICDKTIAKDNPSSAKELKKLLESRLKKAKKPLKQEYLADAPPPIIPKGQKITSLADLDPVEIARQMTLMEEKLFLAIRPKEFYHQAWNKPNKEVEAPNITKLTNNFNKMINWVTTEIVKVQEVKERAEVISKFIRVAKACEQLRNYNGVMEILSALHSSAVSRLKQSWMDVPAKVKETFDELTALMNNASNFKAYRDVYASLSEEESCIPFIAVFLTDYVYLDDLAQDKTPEGWINWRKMGQLADKIRDIRRYKMQRYKLHPVPAVQKFIEEAEAWNDNKTLYAISQLYEGKDGAVSNTLENIGKKGSMRNTMGLKVMRRTTVSNLNFIRNPASVAEGAKEDPNALTDREWKILLTGAQLKTYKHNEIIVDANANNDRLFRVRSGKVRLEKEIDGVRQVLGVVSAGDVFGETSMLARRATPTNFIAIADDLQTEVYIMQIDFVLRMCETDWELSEKLHRILALKLARRLRLLNSNRGKGPLVKQDSGRSTASTAASATGTREADDTARREDEKFVKKFGLPDGEVIVNAFDCSLKTGFVSHGTLFVSPNYLCYGASVFGLKKKEVMAFRHITNIELEKDKQINITTESGKDYTFSAFASVKDAYEFINVLWRQIIAKKEETSQSSTTIHQKKKPKKNASEEAEGTSNESSTSGTTRQEHRSKFELTEADWESILKGANTVTFKKDAPVLSEGDKIQRIYQLVRGSCRIEKMGVEKVTVLGRMTTDDGVFGEISYLEGGSATASVVADEDETSVYIIEGYFLNVLFERNPGLSGRFYHYLAQLLAKRIQQREAMAYQSLSGNSTPVSSPKQRNGRPDGKRLLRDSSESPEPSSKQKRMSRSITSRDLREVLVADQSELGIRGGDSEESSSPIRPKKSKSQVKLAGDIQTPKKDKTKPSKPPSTPDANGVGST